MVICDDNQGHTYCTYWLLLMHSSIATTLAHKYHIGQLLYQSISEHFCLFNNFYKMNLSVNSASCIVLFFRGNLSKETRGTRHPDCSPSGPLKVTAGTRLWLLCWSQCNRSVLLLAWEKWKSRILVDYPFLCRYAMDQRKLTNHEKPMFWAPVSILLVR